MSDWTAGYVTDVGYTYGYYSELNPLRAAFNLTYAGYAAPPMKSACELGFGQGLSINLHAAAGTANWHGTDFNPAHAVFARGLADVAGAEAHLVDEGFAEFCSRTDLPDFDFIGVHGIWTWISDENRRVIVDFARRKLKVGGVLYNSYNTYPGWSTFAPMRHLLTEHTASITAAGANLLDRISSAIGFADKLIATNPAYARANPQVPARLKRLQEQNKNYLAHEYFNRNWNAMYFAEMADWLSPAKLEFACSAHLLDSFEMINLSAEQQALLKEIPDPRFRQTVRDFCVNQQFRRDYWIKGASRLSPLDHKEALAALRVALITPRSDVSFKVTGLLGEATLQQDIYAQILDVLADHRPHEIGDIAKAVVGRGIAFGQVSQAILVLVGKGDVVPVQSDAVTQAVQPICRRLNQHLSDKARGSSDITYLASPVTGGGISVGRFHQLMLRARQQGHTEPEDWARYVWDVLGSQRQHLIKDGKTLSTDEENLTELTEQAKVFAQKRLPVLQALSIA